MRFTTTLDPAGKNAAGFRVPREVVEALGKGKTNQDIARQLQLSVPQVIARGTQIQRKLSLKSANALIRYAVCWVETGAG